MKEQDNTLAAIEKSMRAWIENNLDEYENTPPAMMVTNTQGEVVKKADPALQEIRAAFKDYCYVIKTMREVSDSEDAPQTSSIEELRKRFKVIA